MLAGSLAAFSGAGRGWSAWAAGSATAATVQLKEFKVVPSVRSVRAGKVVFTARNTGKLPHNLVVLRTNLSPGKLPVVGSVAKEVGRRGKTRAFGPGKTRRLALTSSPASTS